MGIFLIIISLFYRLNPQVKISNQAIKGFIFINQVWEGEITINGDITILPFASVWVQPGTKVLFTPNIDLCKGGEGDILDEMTISDPTATKEYAKTHTSINVLGNLTAIGTENEKIIFTSASKNPKETDWNGIIFYGKQASGFLENCIFSFAHYGPAVHLTDNVYIYNSLITNCFWGGLHAFLASPVFINNEIAACGHEGIDLHESGAIIYGNTIKDSLVGIIINGRCDKQALIVEKNKIINCSNFICIQDNAKACIRNNIFTADINKLPKKFRYKGFTVPYSETAQGIEIYDNADVIIENNLFTGAADYSIKYGSLGPNNGINRTGFKGVPFVVSGYPDMLIIKNNTFIDSASLDIPENLKNTSLENNIFK